MKQRLKQVRVSDETHHKLKMLAAEKSMTLDQVLQWLMKVTK